MTRAAIYSIVIAYLTALFIGIACIVFTVHTVNENNRKWCDILSPLDNAYKSAPSRSEVGRKVRDAIHDRTVDFGC